jgi:quercetin dioxygenase-like cupin family protein
MLLVKALENLGSLRGAMYDFEKAGDILPKHNHTEDNVHITIVARGKLKAYSHDWEMEATAGQLLDFPAGQPHELMAMEDNTRIFNIIKNPTDGQAYPTLDQPEQQT